MTAPEMMMETGFFGAGGLVGSHAYMDDEQPFSPHPFWPHPFWPQYHGMVPYFTPGSRMLPSTSCFTPSSYESSPLPWDSDQSPGAFVDNAAFDTFSNNMALERLLPPPLDPDFQPATEIPELTPSASSIEDTEPIQASKSRSKKPQQQEPISPRKPTASLKTPKGKKSQRKTKATLKKASKEASKGGRGALAAVEEDNFRRVLERNRLAAEKCRRRKRDEALTLAAKEEGLESQNQYLSSCYHALKEEVLRLRTELLQHADCDCELIREYIAKEARNTVNSMTPHSCTPDS